MCFAFCLPIVIKELQKQEEKRRETMKGAILRINVKSKKDLKKIFKAERLLNKAGVKFDTGYDCIDGKRDWMLDWSLEGAELKINK